MFQGGNFDIERLCKIRTECNLQEKTFLKGRKLKKIEITSGGKGPVNKELLEKLQEWRSERFKADNVPAYAIMHQSTLIQIASIIPSSKHELLLIKGFGDTRFKKYGEQILAICSEFTKDR